jgi:hypothetical protein
MTCRLRAGAALAPFAAADIELSVDAMLPALTEAKVSSLLASGPKERPPRCPQRRQERRARRDSEGPLATLPPASKELISNVHVLFRPLVPAQMAAEVQSALMSVESWQKY